GSSLDTIEMDSAVIKHTGSAHISVNPAAVVLHRLSEALFITSKATIVRTHGHLIRLDAGTVTLISNEGDAIRVRVLCDRKANSVRIDLGSRSVGVSTGQEVVVALDGEAMSKALRGDPVGHRRVQHSQLPDGRRLAHSEISQISLIQAVDVLSKLMHSHNKEEQAIANRVIKMAACLQQSTSQHGAYTPATLNLDVASAGH